MVEVPGLGISLSLLLLLSGAGLVVAEALAPGAHFIVVGVALLAAGLVGTLLGGVLPGAALVLVLAATVLVAGGATLYGYRQFDFYGGKGGQQTSDSDSLRGKSGRVTEPVSQTGGEVKINEGGFNPYYQARTVDGVIEEGEEVIVVDPGGGNVLTVESVSGFDDNIDRELARSRSDRDEDPDREPEST